MNPASVVDILFRAPLSAQSFRRALDKHGVPRNPFGDANSKTGAPGTYRPVGKSCPTCPYSPTTGNGSCYASGGKVAMQAQRATTDLASSIYSAAAVMVHARRSGTVARLHVSGDFGESVVDLDYVDGLIDAAHAVNDASGMPRGTVVAWSYTHHVDGDWRARLAAAGIAVRLSDKVGEWGAVVVPFSDVVQLRATGTRIAKCPAQLRDVKCIDCRLCWERPEVTIAFDPHGARARKASEASPVKVCA